VNILITDRLRLRPWSDDPGDLAFLFDLYRRPEIIRYIGTNPTLMDGIEAARNAVTRWASLDDDLCAVWAVQAHRTSRMGGDGRWER